MIKLPVSLKRPSKEQRALLCRMKRYNSHEIATKKSTPDLKTQIESLPRIFDNKRGETDAGDKGQKSKCYETDRGKYSKGIIRF